MKNEAQLNADILKITMTIQQKNPELSKYISEMPITIPDVEFPEINVKILQEYYDSLVVLLNKYVQNSTND